MFALHQSASLRKLLIYYWSEIFLYFVLICVLIFFTLQKIKLEIRRTIATDMFYKSQELLDLGEAVGTQNRGLPQELIDTLPTSKYKFGSLFKRKNSGKRCVVCQMTYRRGDQQMKLPCSHVYHGECITKWLSINKKCPVCNTEVFGEESTQ